VILPSLKKRRNNALKFNQKLRDPELPSPCSLSTSFPHFECTFTETLIFLESRICPRLMSIADIINCMSRRDSIQKRKLKITVRLVFIAPKWWLPRLGAALRALGRHLSIRHSWTDQSTDRLGGSHVRFLSRLQIIFGSHMQEKVYWRCNCDLCRDWSRSSDIALPSGT
jgi:hypothetical protein